MGGVRYGHIGGTRAHRVIAERVLGRPLPKGVEVHHVNGDGTDNRHCNLVICESKGYHKLLHVRTRILRAGGNPNTDQMCVICQQPKPHSEFYQIPLRGPWSVPLSNQCRPCTRIAQRDRYRRSVGLTPSRIDALDAALNR